VLRSWRATRGAAADSSAGRAPCQLRRAASTNCSLTPSAASRSSTGRSGAVERTPIHTAAPGAFGSRRSPKQPSARRAAAVAAAAGREGIMRAGL
jgi:hypothetical protein